MLRKVFSIVAAAFAVMLLTSPAEGVFASDGSKDKLLTSAARAKTGIYGEAILRLPCPVTSARPKPTASRCFVAAPYQATFAAYRLEMQLVASDDRAADTSMTLIHSDEKGRFRAALAPGTYWLTNAPVTTSLSPTMRPMLVSVSESGFTKITVWYSR